MPVETIGALESVTTGTEIVAHATINTKGDWVELVASTAADATGLVLVHGDATTADFLIDIGTGAAAAETAIISNFPVNERTTSNNTCVFMFPVAIPAGTRVSARCQSDVTVGQIDIIGYLTSTTVPVNLATSNITTYGAVTADTGGTEIDPGADDHAKGSWVEITASTTADIKWLIPMFGNKSNTARTNAAWLVDIGTGAAASETVVVSDLLLITNAGEDSLVPSAYPPLPVTIASGTRIAVRAQCGITDATDRLIDFILITSNGSAPAAGGGLLVHSGMSGGING